MGVKALTRESRKYKIKRIRENKTRTKDRKLLVVVKIIDIGYSRN